MTKTKTNNLAQETLVEVIKIERNTGISIAKKIMTIKESLAIKNNKGFYYRVYKIGFSSFTSTQN